MSLAVKFHLIVYCQNSVDVSITDNPMALQDAVRGDHLEVTKLLIDHGGKIVQEGNVSISCNDLL